MELLDRWRLYAYLSEGQWFRQVSQIDNVLLRWQTFGVGCEVDSRVDRGYLRPNRQAIGLADGT